MAGETNDIRLQLGAMDKGFTAALKEAQKASKLTYAELQSVQRAAAKGINMPRAASLELAQKNVKNLNEQIKSLQSQRSIALNLDQKERAQKLTAQINNLRANLVTAEETAAKFSFKTAVMGQIKNMQGGIQKAAQATRGLSLAAGGVLVAAFHTGLEELKTQTSAMASLESAEKARFKGAENNVGMTAKMTAEIAKQSHINEGNLDAAVAFGATFTSNQKSLRSITDATTKMAQGFTQQLNPSAEVLKGTMGQVGKAIATGSLGPLAKAGLTVDENTKKLFKMANETQRGAIMAKLAQDNYGNIADKLKKTPDGVISDMKVAWEGISQTFVTKIIPAVLPAIEGLAHWLTSLTPGGVQAIAVALGAMTALSPVLSILGTTLGIVNSILAITAAEGAAIDLAFLPIIAVIGAISLVIIGAIVAWNTNFMGFRTFVIGLWNGIAGAAIGAFTAIGNGAKAAMNWLGSQIFEFVGQTVQNIATAIKLVVGFWVGLKDTIIAVWNGIVFGIQTAVRGIVGAVSGTVQMVQHVFSAAYQFIASAWNNLPGAFMGIGQAILNAMSNSVNAIINVFRNVYNSVVNIFSSIGGAIHGAIGAAIRSIPGIGGSVAKTLGFATGGQANSSGIYRVNEHGQETVQNRFGDISPLNGDYAFLNKGDKVFNAESSKNSLSGGNKTYNVSFNIYAHQGMSEQDVAEQIENRLRSL